MYVYIYIFMFKAYTPIHTDGCSTAGCTDASISRSHALLLKGGSGSSAPLSMLYAQPAPTEPPAVVVLPSALLPAHSESVGKRSTR